MPKKLDLFITLLNLLFNFLQLLLESHGDTFMKI